MIQNQQRVVIVYAVQDKRLTVHVKVGMQHSLNCRLVQSGSAGI